MNATLEKAKSIDNIISKEGDGLSENIIVDSTTGIIEVGINEPTEAVEKNTNDDTISQASTILSTDSQQQQQKPIDDDYVNPRGVRFVQDGTNNSPAVPYGLPCVRELLRFLISLINS